RPLCRKWPKPSIAIANTTRQRMRRKKKRMRRELQMTEKDWEEVDEFTRQRNVSSILAVPATHITEETRAALLKRASVPEDVYAYHSGPPSYTWNLWDTDTRIPFYPLSQVMSLEIGKDHRILRETEIFSHPFRGLYLTVC